MSEGALVALITIVPTTLAVVVGFVQTGNRVDSRIDRVEAGLTQRLDDIQDRLADLVAEQAATRERLAHLEGRSSAGLTALWSPEKRAR